VWQRGTSATASATAFGADRWQFYRAAGAATVTRQVTGDTTNLPNIQYCARVQRNSGNTGTTAVEMWQAFESATSIPFAGKTVTLSFYARKGADFSGASNAMTVYLYTGTGTDQNPISYTGGAAAINTTATLTTTWQRFTYTVTLNSTITELFTEFYYTPVGTAGTNDYFEITGVQLEQGSVATPFSRAGGTIQGELAACQRYYWRFIDGSNQWISTGSYYNAGQLEWVFRFPTPMRTAPTLIISTGTDYYSFSRNNGTDAFNSITLYQATTQSCLLYNSTEVSGTAGQAGTIFSNNASSSVALSAEL
jgi:hypothetical protein